MTALDVRYGRTPRARRRSIAIGVIVGVVIAAVLTLWVVWAGVADTSRLIESRTISRETLSEGEMRVTFEVTSQSEEAVECAVIALNELDGPVGWKIVPAATHEQRTQVVTTNLFTSEPPVNAMVYRCWIA